MSITKKLPIFSVVFLVLCVSAYGQNRTVSVINMIPQAMSGETANDAEPNIAVNPANINQIVASAFTPNPTGAVALAPIFISTNGGATWATNNIVPSANGMTGDITVRFGDRGGTLYTGILRGGGFLNLQILRSANPFGNAAMAVLVNNATQDQPYVAAATTNPGGGDVDRVYVGFNNWGQRSSAGGTGQTATETFSLNARNAAAPAGFNPTIIEARATAEQDMPAIRTAIHSDGTVYAIFYRWTSGTTPNTVNDVVVVRDDNWGTGANPFTALQDPGDLTAGIRVVTDVTVPAFPANLGSNRLVASNLSIAVDPSDSNNVYIAWADRVGAEALYRWYKPSPNRPRKTDHFYTTSTTEPTPGSGYVYEGIAGFLPPEGTPGTVPLYRHYKPQINDHFYTTSTTEPTPGSGYVAEGIQGYIFTSQQPDTVPLHRFWWIPARDHFYTTNKAEGDALGSDANYEGITGYLYAALPTDYTLHVRRSTDRGATWSNDIRRITDATNPALALNNVGRVGFLYQQLTDNGAAQNWETHFEISSDNGTTWADILLANTPDNIPAAGFFLGDYVHVMSVGDDFYGVFSATNVPNNNNFPQGVTYARNANFATQTLLNVNGVTPVNASIDPFFFSVIYDNAIGSCLRVPALCPRAEIDRGIIRLPICDQLPCTVIDPVPKNCLVKFNCPGCGPYKLCPPWYHIYLDDLNPDAWQVSLVSDQGNSVDQTIRRTEKGLVISFRPSNQLFRNGEIGDYVLAFRAQKGAQLGSKYEIPTRLEVSDYPIPGHRRKSTE